MDQDAFKLVRLRSLLESAGGEREAGAFFREHPDLLYGTFCRSGHDRYVFAEFPLGSEHKVDFVLLNSYSGAWEVYFVELEPVGDPVFSRRGTPSARLSGAMRQIDDWRQFVSLNLSYLRSELVRWAKQRDLLHLSSRKEPCNYSGDKLADPRTVILESFLIVIGRSSRLTVEQRRLLGRVPAGHSCSVASYDRILHYASNRYGGIEDPDRWLEPGPE